MPAGLKSALYNAARHYFFTAFIVTSERRSYFFAKDRYVSGGGDADPYLISVYSGYFNFYPVADNNTLIFFSS
jgi:hypothetical protein